MSERLHDAEDETSVFRQKPLSAQPPLRVLHVTPYYAPAYVYGGPTRSVPLLCRGLISVGANVTVLTTDANGSQRLDVPLEVPQDQAGVQVQYFARRATSGRFTSRLLAVACREMIPNYDLVHITGLWTHPAAAAATAARESGIPYIISPRGMLMSWEFEHKAWKKRPYFWFSEAPRLRNAAAIHCTTQAEQVEVQQRVPGARTFVVPNAVDIEELETLPQRDILRRRLDIPSKAPLILFMGRLHSKKGIDLLLDAFLRLSTTVSNAHLVLAGPAEDGNDRRIAAWSRQHRVSSRIHLPGELEGNERLQAYRDADVVALLSRSENFGMSVAEAMACGLPVVVTAGVGVSDWVRDWSAGLVTDMDPTSASNALRSVLEDSVRGGAMGTNGRHLVRSVFEPRAVGLQMLNAYRSLADP